MTRSIGREAEIGLSSFLKNTLRHPLNTAHLRVVVQLQLKIEKSRVVWSRNYGSCYYLLVDMIKLDFLQPKTLIYRIFLAPAVTVGETKGAMDSTSVFFWPLLLPITL